VAGSDYFHAVAGLASVGRSIRWIGGWVDPRSVLDMMVKKTFATTYRGRPVNSQSPYRLHINKMLLCRPSDSYCNIGTKRKTVLHNVEFHRLCRSLCFTGLPGKSDPGDCDGQTL
jgi:hypothetical protein